MTEPVVNPDQVEFHPRSAVPGAARLVQAVRVSENVDDWVGE